MAKYLRDISIHIEFSQELPNGFTQKDFNLTTHTVQNIFWYQIPKKFELDGISKLNIQITSKIPKSNYRNSADGISEYTFGGFDFEKYFKKSIVDKNRTILKVLETAISDILKSDKKKSSELLNITKSIAVNGFKYQTESKKLSKWNKNRTLRALVVCSVDENGQNAFVKIVDENGIEVLNEHLIKNNIYEYYNNLYKTNWTEKKFQILTRDGKIFKEIEPKKTVHNNV
ncbi:hypothetical protein [Croceitalea vernalis]|uniref:Uncharacterized protein n=1 Tax=Croceitalea vernalis TaxID=3075599 RepID=A0ABU3BKH6_9FLAO|nr:hypothetical protein [Croceitalea sp. P007]MDT0622671.1 hypothetical protein [Croceitalea sp. P007]